MESARRLVTLAATFHQPPQIAQAERWGKTAQSAQTGKMKNDEL
jgi:hypothetical protein